MIPRQPDYWTRTILRCARILLAAVAWLVLRGPAFGQNNVGYYAPQWQRPMLPPPQPSWPPAPVVLPSATIVQVSESQPTVLPSATILQVSGSQPEPFEAKQPAPIEVKQPAPVEVKQPSPLELKPPTPVEAKPAERQYPLRAATSLALAPTVTRLQSEDAWRRRLQAESTVANKPLVFPPEAELPSERPLHGGPQKEALLEPAYVCYGRLSFEQRNSERYGWDLGPVQPLLCAGIFYADLVAAPFKCLGDPWRTQECSAGLCLPGDPVPYLVELPFPGLHWRAAEPAGR